MIDLHQARADEWELLKTIRLQALADAPYAFSETLEQASAYPDAVWQERTGGTASYCVLATTEQGTPVGMAVGLPGEGEGDLAYLVSMWVAPAHRGTSLASDLVNAVMGWARDVGAQELAAGITSENEHAQQFYRKLGFVPYTRQSLSHKAVTDCMVVLTKSL